MLKPLNHTSDGVALLSPIEKFILADGAEKLSEKPFALQEDTVAIVDDGGLEILVHPQFFLELANYTVLGWYKYPATQYILEQQEAHKG